MKNKAQGEPENLHMASDDFIPASDLGYQRWLTQFTARCVENEKALGLTEEQIATLTEQSEAFSALNKSIKEKKKALQGDIAQKVKTRRDSIATVRAIARQVKANTSVSPGMVSSLGIVKSRASGPVATVSGLVVKGNSEGVNYLTWDRNGNVQGTVFLIECRLANSEKWDFVAAVTKSSYDDEGQIPGQTKFYRITSIRSGKSSNQSGPVIIYPQNAEAMPAVAA
jgi:hypothetical protein